jgi:uncharacterized membrane protein YphA (DoxX/SURF4 family)
MSRTRQIAKALPRIVLGAIFIYASLDKIADPSGFAEVIANYQILPPRLVPVLAFLLPWVEAVCGTVLIIGRFKLGSTLLINLMMIMFICVTLYNGHRGLDIACGCFTLAAKEPSNIALNTLRDLAILATGIWVMFSEKKWCMRSQGTASASFPGN